jgi:hypothetical protein
MEGHIHMAMQQHAQEHAGAQQVQERIGWQLFTCDCTLE